MNIFILYSMVIVSGLATGWLQHTALSKKKPPMLVAALIVRLVILVAGVYTMMLLHLSPLHFIISIILFWACSWWYIIS